MIDPHAPVAAVAQLHALRDDIEQRHDCAPCVTTRHALADTCRGYAVSLARQIDKDAGKPTARVVGGWFRRVGAGYSGGGLWQQPDHVLRAPGERWLEHWWVEVDGYYLDVTADQFFPRDPAAQEAHSRVAVPKGAGLYFPARRRPLGSRESLPANLEALAVKLCSMTTAQKRWGFRRGRGFTDSYKVAAWLVKYGPKWGLTGWALYDALATLNHESVAVDFHDIESVRAVLREVDAVPGGRARRGRRRR